MSREVRHVREDWEPHDEPLFNGLEFPEREATMKRRQELWSQGLVEGWDGETKPIPDDAGDDIFDWYGGGLADPALYTKERPGDDLTHIVMYETTTEGTPISPKFPNTEQGQEDLARWLADNKASAFAGEPATYDQWLSMIRGPGWAPTGAGFVGGPLMSGVAFMSEQRKGLDE